MSKSHINLHSHLFKNIQNHSNIDITTQYRTKNQLFNDNNLVKNILDSSFSKSKSQTKSNTNTISKRQRYTKKHPPTSFSNPRINPSHMLETRFKFLETAKTLLGIPYGKKYLISHPNYKKNLFLDCCGLVRHAFNLMRKDFGFFLGKWNQCYQYDILPNPIPFEQLQPGDLVFYTGIYYPDKYKKQQLHNIVHVEIYLGPGETTIGSRDSYGVVEVYNTFQFESASYYNIEYQFKSIDTWLKGIHKTFCIEHDWGRKKAKCVKKRKILKNNHDGNITSKVIPKSKSYILVKINNIQNVNLYNYNQINDGENKFQKKDKKTYNYKKIDESYYKIKEKQNLKVLKIMKAKSYYNQYENRNMGACEGKLHVKFPKIGKVLFINHNNNNPKYCLNRSISRRSERENKQNFQYKATLIKDIVFDEEAENKKNNNAAVTITDESEI